MVDTMGNYAICCQHHVPEQHRLNIKHHDIGTWQSSAYMDEVRQAMIADARHVGCQSCWQDEDAGYASMRSRTAKDYAIFNIRPDRPELVNAEIRLGNLCNLTCVMCNEVESSAILAENKRLGINRIEQSDIDWTDQSWSNLQLILEKSPRILNLRGGEPLYNKKILDILEQLPPENKKQMMIHLSTNATLWNDRWATVLAGFGLARIMLSVDGIENVYEYIRYPARWDQLQHNIQNMRRLPNVRLVVNAVVQNLNILHIDDLVTWCKDNHLFLMLDRLKEPEYLDLTNLPDPLRHLAIAKLKTLHSMTLEPVTHGFVTSCLQDLCHTEFDEQLWAHFQQQISMRDTIRGNSHKPLLESNHAKV